MYLNIDYLLHHISYELHTIVKTWTEPLCANTKPSVQNLFCMQKISLIPQTVLLFFLPVLLTGRFFTHM